MGLEVAFLQQGVDPIISGTNGDICDLSCESLNSRRPRATVTRIHTSLGTSGAHGVVY